MKKGTVHSFPSFIYSLSLSLSLSLYSARLRAPCDFINKAISHTPEVEIHTRPKLYHFGRYLVKAKLLCRKCLVPVTELECTYGKIFIPVTEISVAKTEISPGQPGLSYEHINIFTKKRVARRDLGTEPARLTRLI